jgi:alkylated DNA repair dioxygenase AlkB
MARRPSVPLTTASADLFGTRRLLPDGFRYAQGLVEPADEAALLQAFQSLPFKEFEFHGFTGKRRVVPFGWRYDFNGGGLQKTEDIPPFLQELRTKAAGFAEVGPSDLQQVLVTEYKPGAAIGWHKDRPVFGDVVGLSFVSSCSFRFRRRDGAKWERASLIVEPRSAYLLRGPSRSDWEHSIPAVETLRYSVTFRSVVAS